MIDFKFSRLGFLLSLVSFLLISQYTAARVDLNTRVYDYPVYATLGALCGIYLIISLSYLIAKSHWISFIPLRLGQASLYILIFHYFIMKKFFEYFASGVANDTYLMFLSFLTFAVGVFVPLLIKKVVEGSDVLSLAFLPFKSNRLLQRTLYSRNADKQYLSGK